MNVSFAQSVIFFMVCMTIASVNLCGVVTFDQLSSLDKLLYRLISL